MLQSNWASIPISFMTDFKKEQFYGIELQWKIKKTKQFPEIKFCKTDQNHIWTTAVVHGGTNWWKGGATRVNLFRSEMLFLIRITQELAGKSSTFHNDWQNKKSESLLTQRNGSVPSSKYILLASLQISNKIIHNQHVAVVMFDITGCFFIKLHCLSIDNHLMNFQSAKKMTGKSEW